MCIRDSLAQSDEEGQLHFVGRKSQVIVTPSGVNIHPEDVEAALNAQPGVQASAVVPLLATAGTEPVAVLLFRGSKQQAHDAVVAANRQLAEFQQIRQWRLWPELDLPRTSTGKEMCIRDRLVRGQQGVDVGDRLRVTLVRTDPAQGYIDFARA